MRESVLIMQPGITLVALRKIIAVEDEVSEVVRSMGYDLSKQRLSIESAGKNRFIIGFGRGYIGLWAVSVRPSSIDGRD